MIGILAVVSSLVALISEESEKSREKDKKYPRYSRASLAYFALFEANGFHLNEPNDTQFMQMSLGNGLTCPDGHPGPFKALYYVCGDVKVNGINEEDKTISISSDLNWEFYGEPLVFQCNHKEHKDENTKYFLADPLLDDYEENYV